MTPTVHHITQYLEAIAPPAYQADYDNTGLQVGDPHASVTGVLIALDPTQALLEEAVDKGCNLIITHHPLLFRPIKKVTPHHAITRTIRYAIQHDLHLYAIHTNLDHIATGINQTLGHALGLEKLRILAPLPHTHQLLTTYVPLQSLDKVKHALFQAGAGHIEDYEACSFTSTGQGSFHPTPQAQPHIGKNEQHNTVEEACLRTTLPTHLQDTVVAALLQTHPYQTPLYHFQPLQGPRSLGAGMIGTLPQPLSPDDFLAQVKAQLSLPALRHTAPTTKTIQRIAICGGSGTSLLPHASRAKADAFLTADTKYHQFFDAQGHLMLVDIGHYESEIGFKDLIYKLLSKKFHNIALQKCTTYTNPIQYK